MANDNPRLEATSKPSQVRLNIDPENPEAGGQFLPTIFMATKVTRTGRKNSDGTPIFTTEVIRYDNAKKDNPVVIATSSSEKGFRDNNGNENYDNRLKPTANATAAEKASMELAIRNAQLDQVRSVEDQVTTSPADSRELFKVGGDGSESENPDDGIDINEEQASKPLPKNTNPTPLANLQTSGGFRYPLDLDTSRQDSLKIVAFERTQRDMSSGAQGAREKLGTPRGTIILPINGQVAAGFGSGIDLSPLPYFSINVFGSTNLVGFGSLIRLSLLCWKNSFAAAPPDTPGVIFDPTLADGA